MSERLEKTIIRALKTIFSCVSFYFLEKLTIQFFSKFKDLYKGGSELKNYECLFRKEPWTKFVKIGQSNM